MNKSVLFAAVSLIALSACSKNDKELSLAIDKETFEYKKEQVKKVSNDVPSWFTKVPDEKEVVFSTGTSLMPDLQLAIDIARLNAKEQLADRIYSKLRSQTKTYLAKVGSDDFDAAVLNEVEKATKNIVADAEVNGYAQREIAIQPAGIQYRVYVLLAFDSKEAAKIVRNRLMTARAAQSKFQSEKAWKDLDKVSKEIKHEEKIDTFTSGGFPVEPVTIETR